MKIKKILKRLLQLHPKSIDLSLDRIKRLLKDLNNPEKKITNAIQVVGTNGKYSFCSALKEIFETAGYTVNLNTSPSLRKFNERYYLSGKYISNDRLSELLIEVEKINQKKNITLIDYENIREVSGKGYRYLGFGRFAGIVGCYNTLNLYLKLQKETSLPRAFEINSYGKIKKLLGKQNFNNLKILQTGRGNVAKGSMEVLKHANIKQVSINDYLNKKYNEGVFCNISTREYVERNDGKDYSVQDFTSNPHEYKSKVKKYLLDADMLITGHYWEPKFPKLFYPNQINEFKNLKIIGDITCDINGGVPTTIRSTTIAKPYYSIDINSMKEIDLSSKGIAVMAVDNLPSELPNESSEEFGDSVISDVLPYLISKDDGRISRATTASRGKFSPTYSYLWDFIK